MKKVNSRIETIANLFDNILRKKVLVIFVGSNGITIFAYHKDHLIDSVFVDYKEKEHFIICRTFLDSYKKSKIFLLLGSQDCQINHEFMPMLQSIVKSNPVEKFIQDNYNSEDIIAYNVYNVDHSSHHGELWETVIASSKYSSIVEQLLDFVINNSFKFSGIYFLSLEFVPIIDTFLKIQNNIDTQNDLQIFATITRTSDIRIVTKYKRNILDEVTIEFPPQKSDSYIAGTIEQAISNQTLKYKAYAKSLDLKVCLIFLCDKTLCDILKNMPSIKMDKVITYDNMPRISSSVENHFLDADLLDLFIKNKKYPASNKLLNSITTLTTLNSLLFKPIFLAVIGIIIFLIFLKYQSITVQNDTLGINNKYYSLSEQYRNMKKRHPEIEYITNLVELYNLQKLTSVKSLNPSDFLKRIFSINAPNIEIININCYSEELDIIDKKILLTFDLIYLSDKKEHKLADKSLSDYVEKVRILFQDYKVTHEIGYDGIVELPKLLSIPAKIVISKKTAEA